MLRAKGFTIIEVMLVVTIIGILSAIAIPTYLNYSLRAKISEGIVIARPALLAIDDYHRVNSEFPADNAQAGINPPASFKSSIVDKVEILASGKVLITFSASEILNKTITYTATINSGNVIWECSSDLPPVYLPSSCIQ